MKGTTARNCDTHWVGGPDFAVEVRSPGDRTPEKLPFYASVNVRELLVVECHPWSVELFRLTNGELVSVGQSVASGSRVLTSELIPLSFRLIPASARPTIQVEHRQTGPRWSV
jgi:Uma2 family endonuclease